MSKFDYKALGAGGKIETGQLQASDRHDALRQLEKRGLKPVRVGEAKESEPARGKAAKSSRPASGGASREKSEDSAKSRLFSKPEAITPENWNGEKIKLRRAEIILFTEELSEMLGAGLQLEPALRVMEGRTEAGSIKVVASLIRAQVRDGATFSASLRKVSNSFGPLYCALAAAGEASGALDSILQRQAQHLRELMDIQNRVVLALIYPAFVVLAVIALSGFFLFYLLPQLVGQMKNMPGSKLPTMVEVLMGFTSFISSWWFLIVLGVVLAIFLFISWKNSPANRPTWDRVKLRLPLVGALLQAGFHVQFLETLSNIVGNGLPLLRGLELTSDATQNVYLQSRMKEMIDLVGDGRALSRTMTRAEIFPAVIVDMVSVGEQTGHLGDALKNAATRADKQLSNTSQRLTAILTPAVMMILAVIVGTMMWLMFSLIYQTIDSMRSF